MGTIKLNIYSILAAAIFIVAAVACDKNENEPETPVDNGIIELSVKINNGTKATFVESENETECNFVWNRNDAIAVINNRRLYKFVLNGEYDNKEEGIFVMDKSVLPAEYIEGDFLMDSPLQLFYPYEGVSYDPTTQTINYTLPAEQSYEQNGIAKKLMPMAGYSNNATDEIIFSKLLGVLKISIEGSSDELLKRMEIVSSYKLNGKSNITIEEGYESRNEISLNIYKNLRDSINKTDYNRITMSFQQTGESISEAKVFYIPLTETAKDLGLLIYTNLRSYYKEINPKGEKVASVIKAGETFTFPLIDTKTMPPAYIENGVYLGDGITLPKSADGTETLIWAPVNCGYEAEIKDGGQTSYKGYPFGKLYQWGRKDGQGYIDIAYEDNSYPYEPSTNPSGNPDPDKFYQDWSLTAAQWPENSNPCPEGWRVPTSEELISLVQGLNQNDYLSGLSSHWVSSNSDKNSKHYGQPGFHFYGNTSEKSEKVFFPAAGFYKYDLSGTQIRGLSGCYWSATANGAGNAWYMDFNRKGYIDTYYDGHAYGRSVRCVKNNTK